MWGRWGIQVPKALIHEQEKRGSYSLKWSFLRESVGLGTLYLAFKDKVDNAMGVVEASCPPSTRLFNFCEITRQFGERNEMFVIRV